MLSEMMSEQVPKTEDAKLNDYELVVIINPEIVDENLETAINNISQFITERGGVISGVEQWGKRRLSYPIKHFMEGNYVLTQLKLRPTLSQGLQARLQISEDILRYLLIKTE